MDRPRGKEITLDPAEPPDSEVETAPRLVVAVLDADLEPPALLADPGGGQHRPSQLSAGRRTCLRSGVPPVRGQLRAPVAAGRSVLSHGVWTRDPTATTLKRVASG